MSTVVQDHQTCTWVRPSGVRMRRVLIVIGGCAVMAASGLGLGAYLDTSSAVAADAPQASSGPTGGD